MASLMDDLIRCYDELHSISLKHPHLWLDIEHWFLKWKGWFVAHTPELVADVQNLAATPLWMGMVEREGQADVPRSIRRAFEVIKENTKRATNQKVKLEYLVSGLAPIIEQKLRLQTAAAAPPSALLATTAAAGPSQSVRVFVSYAREDAELRTELNLHLASLRNDRSIVVWNDVEILPGENWDTTIRQQLEGADVIVMLVSAHFLASDYCQGVEVRRALQKHDAGSVRVVPVLVRATDWQRSPLGRLQALPSNARAVTSWNNRDEAWEDVAIGVRRLIEELAAARRRG